MDYFKDIELFAVIIWCSSLFNGRKSWEWTHLFCLKKKEYLLCLYVLVISGVAWKEVSNVKHKLENLILDNHIAKH